MKYNFINNRYPTKQEIEENKFVVNTQQGFFAFFVTPKITLKTCVWQANNTRMLVDNVTEWAMVEKKSKNEELK